MPQKIQPDHPPQDRHSNRRHWGRAQWDRILDPYKRVAKLEEPAVCSQCGAVYANGRWQWTTAPAGATRTLCQACHRVNDRYPAGVVTLRGRAVSEHRDEIVSLARHQETAEKREHPLNRIMKIESEAADRLVITTTDIHLPRRIGEAVERAFHGELDIHFDEQGYFVRVDWRHSA